MLIYDALKKDHRTVQGLLNDLVSLSSDSNEQRHALIAKIRDELVPHSRAEEAVLYNSMRMLDASKALAMHGYKEHLEAETLLRSLQIMDMMDSKWKATALKLQTALNHHIEEEEGEIFSAAQQLFTTGEAEMMGETFEKMKPGIKEESLMGTTFEMVKNMMPPRLAMALEDFGAHFTAKKDSAPKSNATRP